MVKVFDFTSGVQPIRTVNGLSPLDIASLAQHFIELADYMHKAGYNVNSTKCCEIADNLLDEQEFLSSLPKVTFIR